MSGTRELPRASTYASTGGRTRATAATGSYNSLRAVPPPTRSRATPGAPPSRARSAVADPFLVRVVVLVDEATEPGITDEEGERRRVQLVNVVLDRSLDATLPAPATASPLTGGQAVAFALRKRLKSEDEVAVLNTLTLLDELMRTCPYFYRFVANEKFFRRLWRFVVPDYKNGVKSMIPLFGKPRLHAGMRGPTTDVAERVMILIRAWAEELSVMYNGRYDPDAGFLIERYNSKRARIKFPDVPATPLPWVCPIGASPDALRTPTRAALPESMGLAEVENTANLFTNLLDNATSVADLRDDLCAELAARCKLISQNLSQLSMNMSKEEELTRAIAVSETLQSSLARYRQSLNAGELVSPPSRSSPVTTVDRIDSVHSEDEGYDDRHPAPARFSDERDVTRYSDDSSDLEDGAARARAEWALRADDARDTRDLRHARSSTLTEPYPSRRYAAPARDSPPRSRSPVGRKALAPAASSAEKRVRRATAKSAGLSSRRQKSDSDLVGLVKEKEKEKKKSKAPRELLSIDDIDSSDPELDNAGARASAAALLAERYASERPARKPKAKASKSSRAAKASRSAELLENPQGGASQQASSAAAAVNSQLPPVNPAGSSTMVNPNSFYQSTTPGVPFNAMMMPNPYQMYGTVGSVPMQDPMGMLGAYQTVNPAMYYGSYNPNPQQMYASVSSMPPFVPAISQGAGPSVTSPQQSSGSTTPRHSAPQDPTSPQQLPQTVPQQMAPPPPPTQMVPPQQMLPQQMMVPAQQMMMPQHVMPSAQLPPRQLPSPGISAQPSSQAVVPSAALPTAMGGNNTGAMSFFASVPGQNQMATPNPQPMVLPPPSQPLLQVSNGDQMSNGTVGGPPQLPSQMPPQTPPQMPSQAPPFQSDASNEAAKYQSAMQQAAMAYHNAATAYRSVSGQTPVAMPPPTEAVSAPPLPGSESGQAQEGS